MPSSGRHLDNWITGYLEYVAQSEGSESYKYWTGISTIAACLQRKCYLPWDHLSTIYPNLFIILVGPSGIGKSRALTPARDILQKFYGDEKLILAPEKITAEAFMKRMASLSTEEPEDHVSITIFSPEIRVFVGTPPQNITIVTAMCDFFDCTNPWTYETITRGEGIVNRMWVNLLGGATPEGVAGMFPESEAVHGGITGRIIFVYSDDPGPIVVQAERQPEMVDLAERLYEDMETIIGLEGAFKWSNDYLEIYGEWRLKNEAPEEISQVTQLAPYIQRRHLFVRKLSMIHCGATTNSMYLTSEHFSLALESLERVEQTMHHAFKCYGATVNKVALEKLVHHLMRVKEMRLRTLFTYFSGDFLFPDFKRFVESVNEMEPPVISMKQLILEDKTMDWIIRRVGL